MKLAVIPARGGSKRIPRKNILPFCGQPMIAYAINAARDSGCFDRIVVSTDDEEIAEVARSFGAEVPFMRPADLADDHTGTTPVVSHAVDWQRKHGAAPSLVCCIYATAPFLQAEDLERGQRVMCDSGADFALSVTSYPFPIQRAVRIASTGRLEMFSPDQFETRSQDLEEAWHDAGQFYWGTADAWRAGRPLFGPGSVPIVLPRYRVQDIDTFEDWTRAELLFTAMHRAT